MGRRKKGDKIDGWINLDKPLGLTSTQALGKIRRYLNPQKIGHAGTLDPLATGILPVALGEATKLIPYIQDREKTYRFTVRWGEQRSTDDAEGEILHTSDTRPTENAISALLPHFIGEIEQTPPQFSAIKVDGQRAYDLARSGEDVALKSRIVTIHSLEITNHSEQDTSFQTICGKGTYIRSIARDLGQKLGCYGYVSHLRREAVSSFKLENAISLDNLEKTCNSADRFDDLLELQSVLDDIPALELSSPEAAKLQNGQALPFISRPDFERLKAIGFEKGATLIAIAMLKDKPLGIVDIEAAEVKPKRLLNL